jgi:hypothetical protein
MKRVESCNAGGSSLCAAQTKMPIDVDQERRCYLMQIKKEDFLRRVRRELAGVTSL